MILLPARKKLPKTGQILGIRNVYTHSVIASEHMNNWCNFVCTAVGTGKLLHNASLKSPYLLTKLCALKSCFVKFSHICTLLIKSEIFEVFSICFIFSSSCGKEKKINLKNPKADLWGIQIQKEVKSNPKQPSCKKECGPQKDYGEKRCKILGGGQEMAVMVG